MRADRVSIIAVPLAVFGLLALPSLSRPASAGPELGIEVDAAFPTGDTNDAYDIGWGLEGRGGFGLPGPVDLVFEALFDWATFGVTDLDARTDVIRVAGGVRVGVPIPLIPELFAHAGWGQASFEFGQTDSESGFTWDVGLASDLLSLSVFSVGLHVSYKQLILDNANFNWVGLGAHFVLGF